MLGPHGPISIAPGPRIVVPTPPTPTQRLYGTLSWNLWTPDQLFGGQTAAFFLNYTHLKRVGWGGPNNWYLYSALNPLTINTQAVVDASVCSPAAGILDFVMHDFYPPRSLITNPSDQGPINDQHVVYDAHVASTVVNKPKFCLLAQVGWLSQGAATLNDPWPYFDNMVAYFRQEMARPDWIRVRIPGAGLVPLLGLFDATTAVTGGANCLAQVLAFRNQLPQCLFISVGAVNPAHWAQCRCDGGTSYGANGATVPGLSEHSWVEQDNADASIAGQSNFFAIRSINYFRDPRPRSGAGVSWSDKPAMAQYQSTLAAVNAQRFEIIMIGEAGNELDESSGGVYPDVQGAPLNAGGRSAPLDGVAWQKGVIAKPATYLSKIPCVNLLVTVTGTWTLTQAIAGAWDSQFVSSSTIGDTRTVTVNAATCGTDPNPTVQIWGPTGPALGSFDVLRNGVFVQNVSQVSGSTVQGVLLASVACVPGDTVSLRVASGTVEHDAWGFLFAP